jgi:mRNA interferase MazF
MEKDFSGWHHLKARLDASHNAPTFQEREVWWCSIGVNVGQEMDGKNQFYNRPVLIARKFNAHIFLGVPLTTQIKQNPYYHLIQFKGRDQCVMLSQLRLWEGKRLTHKMGKLPKDQFFTVRKALKDML